MLVSNNTGLRERALQMTKGSPVAVLLGWKLPLASHLHVYSTACQHD